MLTKEKKTEADRNVVHGDRAYDFTTGEVLLVDKPLDWTSFDVVNKVRNIVRVKKVGHAGTLDPKATGLLIICTGKKTKSISEFAEEEKEYEGVLELGAITPSFDTETDVIERKSVSQLAEENIYETARTFIGMQQQIPPMFSALKYGGKPLYTYARKGKTLPRDAREIVIQSFDITMIQMPFVHFRVVCSKGTYVRSLVDELGRKLGCGAYLKSLRRTRIGKFHVADALLVEDLRTTLSQGQRFGSN